MSNMVEEKSKKATKRACYFIREFRVLPENRQACGQKKLIDVKLAVKNK